MGALDFIGGLFNAGTSMWNTGQTNKQAKKMAATTVQTRVADARAAGINPLAALGYSGSQPSLAVGDLSPIGNSLKQMGQDTDRAEGAAAKQQDRDFIVKRNQLELQRLGLENQLLGSKIRQIDSPGNPPPIPEHKVVPPQVTKTYRMFGFDMVPNPWFSDAQTLEDRGGDYAGGVIGAANMVADPLYSLGQYIGRKVAPYRYPEVYRDRRLGPS